MQIQIAGENSLIVYFHHSDPVQANTLVSALVRALDNNSPYWLIDLTPAYHSVLVTFDCMQTDFLQVKRFIRSLNVAANGIGCANAKRVVIPLYYDPPGINDLERIIAKSGLAREEIIHIHETTNYRVYAIGFAPGFAFLGDVDPRIAVPRLSTPRKAVPKGALGIADQQTAIYPDNSPGGWNIIGLSPFKFFAPDDPEYQPLQVGDEVSFKGITKDEYIQQGGCFEF